jgi:hypothetical protein
MWQNNIHKVYFDWRMEAVAALVETEVHTIPEGLRHVLSSRALHSHDSLTGRLICVAKSRNALIDGATYAGNW